MSWLFLAINNLLCLSQFDYLMKVFTFFFQRICTHDNITVNAADILTLLANRYNIIYNKYNTHFSRNSTMLYMRETHKMNHISP